MTRAAALALGVGIACALLAPGAVLAADDAVLRVSAPAALMPAAKGIADAYSARYGHPVELVVRGSRDGIAALRSGQADVALSDSAAADDGLAQTTIAYAPLALVADPNVGVTSLRADDARRILDGTIASWRALGGRDVAIARFDRPFGSATDRVVSTALKLNPKRVHGSVDDTSPAVVGDVKATSGGVGVVVLPYAGDLRGVRVLTIDGHAPDADGARAGYPLLGAEFAITLGAPTLGISRFVAYLRSSSDLWRANALIPIRDVTGR